MPDLPLTEKPPALIVDGVLLAGGRSTRMGEDKARLPHPVSGRSLVVHQWTLLREATGRPPLLSVRSGADYPEIPAGLPRVFDDGARGPLAALHAALAASDAPFLLALAVDMPGVTNNELRQLLAAARDSTGVVAAGPAAGLEPLLALYPRKAALDAATMLLAADKLALRGLVDLGLRDGWLRPLADLAPGALQNWNTPAHRDSRAWWPRGPSSIPAK